MSSSVAKLLEMLEKDIERLDDQSRKHKRLHRRVQTAVIALTAITTVAAGAGLVLPNSQNISQFVVLALAATTTAATAWVEMRRARELWQHEREIFWALSDIRREVNFYSAVKELSPSEVEDFFKRISSVLGSSMHRWTGILEKQKT